MADIQRAVGVIELHAERHFFSRFKDLLSKGAGERRRASGEATPSIDRSSITDYRWVWKWRNSLRLNSDRRLTDQRILTSVTQMSIQCIKDVTRSREWLGDKGGGETQRKSQAEGDSNNPSWPLLLDLHGEMELDERIAYFISSRDWPLRLNPLRGLFPIDHEIKLSHIKRRCKCRKQLASKDASGIDRTLF